MTTRPAPLAAAAGASVEAADAARFQAYLRQRQYPPDCSRTVGVLTAAGYQRDGTLYKGDYFNSLGLGSQMASLRFNLLHTLLKPERVYHFPTTHYANPLRCKGQSFGCYFEVPTNCSADPPPAADAAVAAGARARHRKLERARLLWCADVPRHRLSRLAGLRATHAAGWYLAQLSAFLFRPNAEMRAFADEARGSGLESANGSQAPGGASWHSPSSCVGMHIRRTDKFRGGRREDARKPVDFEGFSRAFKAWTYWHAPLRAGQMRVMLGSEDPTTFRASATPPRPAPLLPGPTPHPPRSPPAQCRRCSLLRHRTG